MLPTRLRPRGFDTWEKETWDEYQRRLELPADEATLQFHRQVVYDHFKHFNRHYPSFVLSKHRMELIELTAQEADDTIRYFENEVMDWWGEQFDQFEASNQQYIIFQAMSKNGTFPFPPVVMDGSLLKNVGRFACGRPLHLVEGTHRVSYLRHMLRRGLVAPSSKHGFVLVRPRAVA